jgi:hypothetical protein
VTPYRLVPVKFTRSWRVRVAGAARMGLKAHLLRGARRVKGRRSLFLKMFAICLGSNKPVGITSQLYQGPREINSGSAITFCRAELVIVIPSAPACELLSNSHRRFGLWASLNRPS